MIPDFVNYIIDIEVSDPIELSEELEKTFGTKIKPLRRYETIRNERKCRDYRYNKKIVFIHWNYDGDLSEIWLESEYLSNFKKFDIPILGLKKIIHLYIKWCYDLNTWRLFDGTLS
jgi:hypothetical protein